VGDTPLKTVASGAMTSTRDPDAATGTAPPRGRARAIAQRPGVRRFSKYAVGSVVAFGASNVAFLLLYGLGLTSPQVASVLAFAAGIPVNYVLNRRWAWQRRGRPGLRDELLPYAAVVATSVIGSAVGTWAADRWVQSAGLPRAVEVGVVDAAFVAINGTLFLLKYVLLDRLVFRERPSTTDATDGRAAERVP
jgi:putative flippase GtrA